MMIERQVFFFNPLIFAAHSNFEFDDERHGKETN